MFEIAEGVALASPHLPDFVIEEAGDEDTEFEDIEDEVVHIFNGNGNGNGNDTAQAPTIRHSVTTIREQARYDTEPSAPTIRPAGYDNGNVNGNGNQRAVSRGPRWRGGCA
ncbi:MAG: hypothetical protein IJ895_04340 [Prevotella sp.]|nr:hypothetical protein [Prevotella sp.]